MQVHLDAPHPGPGDIRVSVNPGNSGPFAVVKIGPVEAYLQDDADCDALIIAVTSAKRMRQAAESGEPHSFSGGAGDYGSHCEHCGLLGGGAIHAPAAVLAASIASGQPLAVTEDERTEPWKLVTLAPQCPAGLLREGEDWGVACQKDGGHAPPHDGQDGEWTDDHPRHLPDLDARFPVPAPLVIAPGESAGPASLASVATLPGGTVTARVPRIGSGA